MLFSRAARLPPRVVNGCGHGQEFVPWPEEGGQWMLVPVVEAVANPFTEDLVLREASRLLRGPYRGKFLCFSCLGSFIRKTLATARTEDQIERALLAVSNGCARTQAVIHLRRVRQRFTMSRCPMSGAPFWERDSDDLDHSRPWPLSTGVVR